LSEAWTGWLLSIATAGLPAVQVEFVDMVGQNITDCLVGDMWQGLHLDMWGVSTSTYTHIYLFIYIYVI